MLRSLTSLILSRVILTSVTGGLFFHMPPFNRFASSLRQAFGSLLASGVLLSVSATSLPASDETVRQSDEISEDKNLPQKPAGSIQAGELHRLTEELRGPDFTVRQAAARRLLELGMAAESALLDVVTSDDAELRDRVAELLRRIHQKEFTRRLASLNLNPAAELAAEFPEWGRYTEIVSQCAGCDKSKLVSQYLKLLQTDSILFSLHMFSPEKVPAWLEQRSSQLAKTFNDDSTKPFPVDSYAALLLIASNPAVRLPRATSANLSAALADDRLRRLVARDEPDGLMAELLRAWILRPGISTERPLLFCMETRLSSGLTLARRIIESRSKRPEMQWALLAVGVLGSDDDLPMLERQFDNDTVLWPRGVPLNQPAGNEIRGSGYRVLAGDIALAVAVQLRGANCEDFGISARRSEVTGFAADSLGFSTAELRKEGFTRYRSEFSQN